MATDPTSSDGRKRRKSSPRQNKSGKQYTERGLAARMVRYGNPEELEKARARIRAIKSPGRAVGSYDGMRKDERDRVNAEAKQYAKETIKIMADKGIITPEDDPRATEALEAAIETMRKPTNQGTKLAAAKLILEYTKAKPASKSEVTVNKAEEWLAAIADEEKSDGDNDTDEGDAKATA